MIKPGLYLNERNGDLITLENSKYQNSPTVIEACYLCPVTNKECSTEFEIATLLTLTLTYIGEV